MNNSHFFLPQILAHIFIFLSGYESVAARIKIIENILDLLDTNPSNIKALLDNAWLVTSVKLDALQNYKMDLRVQGQSEMSEQSFVRKLFCVVLCHCIQYVKGGWQHLEETTNVLLMHCEQDSILYRYLLHDMYEDLVPRLIELSSEDNIFLSQPCRDNTLYLLKLVYDLLIFEVDAKLLSPETS